MKWFQKCLDNKFPKDQSNLFSIYFSQLEKNLDSQLPQGSSVSFDKVITLLKESAAILSEPNRHHIQDLEIQQFELEDSLKSIKIEIDRIENLAERRISIYLYLIILGSIAQILFFYYCIF